MKLDITDQLYAELMSALRQLERADPQYIKIRKKLLAAMIRAATEEVSLTQQETA